jgi:hypothetical protein
MTTAITSFSPAPAPPTTLPDGRAIETVSQGELNTIFEKIGVVGFSHRNGLAVNIGLYEAHLKHIAAAAGEKAIADWFVLMRERV